MLRLCFSNTHCCMGIKLKRRFGGFQDSPRKVPPLDQDKAGKAAA